MSNISQFWETMKSSACQSESESFLGAKSREHVGWLTLEEQSAGAVDLGCGAGELLVPLSNRMKIVRGIDFSSSMVEEAKRKLAQEGIVLPVEVADVFEFLPQTKESVWLTSQALNQYLGADELGKILRIFCANPHATTFALYDCIDSSRYDLLFNGMSYRKKTLKDWQSFRKRLGRFYRRIIYALNLVFGKYSLPERFISVEMGYSYLPLYYLEMANSLGLDVQIISSAFFEYRYHVILRKRS